MPARLLKTLSKEIAPAVTAIFRQSIASGELPNDWKKAWITPVYKKGNCNDPANYRPVSLTCIVCKLLEHVLCTHIRAHLDRHGILTPIQHGFRSGHSTESQLLLTTHELLKERDAGKQVDVVILDFSKAFDTVPHKRLLGKLELYGINGNILRWISGFLTSRKQSVVVDGSKSEEADVISGVPQGTVLGPLLFLMHINDLPDSLHHETRCRLFADDSLIYRVINSISDQIQLQKDLLSLEEWAATWGMSFNASKCHVMTIARRKTPKSYMYQLCGTFLSCVTQEKYLGVLISDDLSWAPHINTVVTKSSQKLGFLKRNLKGSPVELKRMAYVSIVRSSLEYASTVWDPGQVNHKSLLERVQRRAARWIKSDYDRYASVTTMLQSLGLETLEERRRMSRLAFLYKVLHEEVAVP